MSDGVESRSRPPTTAYVLPTRSFGQRHTASLTGTQMISCCCCCWPRVAPPTLPLERSIESGSVIDDGCLCLKTATTSTRYFIQSLATLSRWATRIRNTAHNNVGEKLKLRKFWIIFCVSEAGIVLVAGMNHMVIIVTNEAGHVSGALLISRHPIEARSLEHESIYGGR